jgi:hypothetical protein
MVLAARLYFYKCLKRGTHFIFKSNIFEISPHIGSNFLFVPLGKKSKKTLVKTNFLNSFMNKGSLILWSKECSFHGFGSDEAFPAFLSFFSVTLSHRRDGTQYESPLFRKGLLPAKGRPRERLLDILERLIFI